MTLQVSAPTAAVGNQIAESIKTTLAVLQKKKKKENYSKQTNKQQINILIYIYIRLAQLKQSKAGNSLRISSRLMIVEESYKAAAGNM